MFPKPGQSQPSQKWSYVKAVVRPAVTIVPRFEARPHFHQKVAHKYLYSADSDYDRDDFDDFIYMICSIQLWRTTRAAAEISRQAALGNLWAELNRYLEILRQQDAPETAFLQKVSDLMLEFMIANLLTHAIEKNDQRLRDPWSSVGFPNSGQLLKSHWEKSST